MQTLPQRVAIVALAVLLLGACQRSNVSVLGPSILLNHQSQLAGIADPVPLFGAGETGTHNSAGQESGFACFLFGTRAEQSHATISESGNQTMHCSGKTDLPAQELTVPCPLFFGGVDPEGEFTVNPSGHASLKCQAKK